MKSQKASFSLQYKIYGTFKPFQSHIDFDLVVFVKDVKTSST